MQARETAANHSFLIRIYRTGQTSDWQGWAQHTRSGEVCVFHTLDRLLEFMQQHTGELKMHEKNGLR